MSKKPVISEKVTCPCGWSWSATLPAPTDHPKWEIAHASMHEVAMREARAHLDSGVCALGVLRRPK